MKEQQRKGPSLAAFVALATLAVTLWMEVDLATALLRSVMVYMGLSLLMLIYRTVLTHIVVDAEKRTQSEFLEKLQREAEEEARQKAQKQPRTSNKQEETTPETKENKVLENA